MKILICMAHLSPWSRPAAATLQSLGHEVHVFDFADVSENGYVSRKIAGIVSDFDAFRSEVSGIHLVPAPAENQLRYVLYARRFRRLAETLGVDLVLTLYGGGFALMAYLSGFRPYSVFVVGSDVLQTSGLTRRINRRTLARASQVFANGEYLAARAREQAPTARIRPLLIGIDTRLFHPSATPPVPVRFFCSRGFEDVYNNESILRALSRLPADSPDFRVVFPSGGPGLPGATALADATLTPDMRRRVEFWGGASHAQMVEGLHGSHAYVSMSRSDGTSASLLEGLACGLYPILSDIPANREWIFPEKGNGALVPLDDDDALARAILSVLRDPVACAASSEFNRTQVRERADAKTNRRLLARALEDIVAAAGSRSVASGEAV